MASEELSLINNPHHQGSVSLRSESDKGETFYLLSIRNNGQLWIDRGVRESGTNFNLVDNDYIHIY